MSRYIDADAISFRCSYGGMCMGDIENCRSCEHYVCNYEDIQNIPTAYDVKKVVAELEKEKGKYYKEFEKATDTLSGICYGNMSNVYGHAIIIVKRGGVNE